MFIVAIAFLVIADLLVPPGSISRPDRWTPLLRARVERARRYAQLTRIAMCSGLIPFRPATESTLAAAAERSRQGKALRRALEEAGGAFVKLGQMLSTRTDLLPTEFLEELAQLQQAVPPAAWPEVRALIEEELNSPIDAVFADFAEVPMASASIGQVHLARLHDGREVAVKVQCPGILPLIERDTDIAMRIAAKLEQTASWARDLGITELARGLVATSTTNWITGLKCAT